MMKKWIAGIGVVVAAIGIYVVWVTYPKPISLNVEGIKYQLGDKNPELAHPITIKINGELQTSLTGNQKFKGTIDLEGVDIPVPVDQRKLEINFGKMQQGGIYYGYYSEDHIPMTFAYGGIFINRDFSKFTIFINKKDESDASRSGWEAVHGLMISAPAASRSEALQISNDFMSSYLHRKLK
jgi:hypothetical protein